MLIARSLRSLVVVGELLIAVALVGGIGGMGGIAGCKKKSSAARDQTPGAAAPDAPVPRPAGVVAEGVVRSPQAILASLQAITPLAPSRLAPIVADALHVDKEVADQVDPAKPIRFVVALAGEEASFAVAAPVRDPKKTVAALGKGAFKRSDDTTLGMVVFESTSTPRTQVVGVQRSWLLASASVAALKELGGYATRTLAAQPLPVEDMVVSFPEAAVRTTLREKLHGYLQAGATRRREAARASRGGGAGARRGGGILEALVDVMSSQNARAIEMLADAGDGRIALSTSEGSFRLRGEVAVPSAAGDGGAPEESTLAKSVAGWAVGGASNALDLPSTSVATFSMRSTETQRAASSADILETLGAMLPKQLDLRERVSLTGFLTGWDKARDELLSGALIYEGRSKIGVALRIGARDATALSDLVQVGVKSALSLEGVRARLAREGVGAPTFSTEKLATPDGGTALDAHVVTFKLPRKTSTKDQPAKGAEPETAEIVWAPLPDAAPRQVALAAGVGARAMLTRLIAPRRDSDELRTPLLATELDALGKSISGAALLLPSRIGPFVTGASVGASPPPSSDPVVVAVGREKGGVVLTASVSRGAVEKLLGLAMGGALGR